MSYIIQGFPGTPAGEFEGVSTYVLVALLAVTDAWLGVLSMQQCASHSLL
jgi:hypothetical protein